MKNNNYSVADMFSANGEKPKIRYKHDYTNGNVYARNWSATRIQNVANDFTQIVKNEDLKEVKLIGEYAVTDFPIECNNRVNFFYAPTGKKVSYSEITKCEEIDASKYSSDATNHLKNIGFTKFIQLYKLNDFGVESKLCRMAIRFK